MFRKKGAVIAALLLVMVAVLAACQAEPVVEQVEVTRVVTETVEVAGETVEVTRVITEVEEEVVEVTRVIVEEVEPEQEEVDRQGAWVDTVIVVEEPSADAAVSRLEAGDIDVYAYAISSPETAAQIRASEALATSPSFGSYNELTLNPAECTTGALNPFSNPRIREAMNFAVDRNFIVQEIMGGLASPRWTPINAASADAARLAPEIRQLELQYQYDLEQAREIMTEELEAMGATLENGVWTFDGEPIELIFLIRTEDERLQIGDYVANQMEELGFTVVRDYRTSAEASPIWYSGDPAECQFHVYTGGWVSTAISRDAGANFEFFYTAAGLPGPLWQAYTPTEEFAAIAQSLANNEFATMEERSEMFAEALPLALEDSVRVWLLDRQSIAPYREEIAISSDLSGSVYGSWFWPLTLRRGNEVGGSVTIAMPSILTEPWNPIAGSNWIYDQMLIRSTGQLALLPDPSTGLALPNRIESATVTVQEDLPVSSTMDYLEVERVAEIEVPDDAWVNWDAEAQMFMTASEVYTETETALLKSTITFPEGMYEAVEYHDGSQLDVADFVMRLIVFFDRANEASPYFDAAEVPAFESFMSTFKGYRIVSEDPLTIEYYTDNWSLDAENALGFLASWPYYGFGPGAWHNVALGLFAEADALAAFSSDKATELEVEQINYISGPVLDILGTELTEAAEANAIPYEPTLGQYITADEASERWANLQEWNRRRGHYWIGTGPMFLQRAFPVEGNVILEQNPNFVDAAGRWSELAGAPIPQVEVEGPGRVTIGDEAAFDVFVDTPAGDAYPTQDVGQVQYLLFDALGNLVTTGEAEAVEDGLFQVVVPADVTEGLEAGSNRLEVVVVSDLVALPASGGIEFVTAP